VGSGDSVSVGVSVGASTGSTSSRCSAGRASSGVRLVVKEGGGVAVGRAVGAAVGAVKKNGWQAESRTIRVNASRGGVRGGMRQV